MTAESQQQVIEMFENWSQEIEKRGLKVNTEKTKIMITGKQSTKGITTGKWPCGCCGRGVGANSILCVMCNKWCHRKCSGLKRVVGVKNFQCPACKRGSRKEDVSEILTTRGKLEEVQEFCYLGDVLDGEAGTEKALRTRVAKAWRKWKEMASLLNNKNIPLKTRSSVYETCVRSVLLYGAETWAMTTKLENVLKTCDYRMMRYMAGVKWQDRISNEEVVERCGIKDMQHSLRHRRLQWFGHVKRRKESEVLRKVNDMEIEEKGVLDDQDRHGSRL